MTPATATCQQCGAPIIASVARGLCPACLLDTSLGSENEDDSAVATIDTAWLERQGMSRPPVAAAGSRRFGDYDLFEEIGRGGMGVIYRANQISLQRTVAVKTILTGPLAGPDFVQRFRTEAHAAAVLDHPNIVPIFEVGEHQGQPYYSMRLIAGRNLAQALKEAGPMPPRRAAKLIATIARAIHYAHQRGILHRDLKPANIMLDADGEPHVTDFGLAKLLEQDDGLTLTQAALGTPNYMAPEQAAGDAADLTTAADTYSLGAILFEVLTGQRLFAAATPLATINQAREQESPRPSTILRSIPRDLDTICGKCLEKEPRRRYATTQELAEDLEHWLAGEPIRARRVGTVERVGLWCRRKPAMARLAGAALLAVLIAAGIGLWRVTAARHQKELEQYSANISLADAYVRDGGIDQALALLLQCPPRLRHWEWGRLLYMCHQEIASIPAHTNRPQYRIQSLIRRVAANRDGTRIATHGADGQLKLWDPSQSKPLVALGVATNSVTAWEFSPDGHQFVVGTWCGTLQLMDAVTGRPTWSVARANRANLQDQATTNGPSPKTKRIVGIAYDAREDTPIFDPASAEPETILAIGYASDSRRLATATGDGAIILRDAATGRELAKWRHGLSTIEALWFTPDGQSLVAKDRLALEQFDSTSGEARTTRRWDPNEYTALFVDPSGRNAATLSPDHRVQLWRDGEKTHALGLLGAKGLAYRRIIFDPGGDWVCLAGGTGNGRLHEVATGRLLFSVPHTVLGAEFSPDGNRLVTFGAERLIRLWDVAQQLELRVLRGHLSIPDLAAFSGDGNFIATASRDGIVKLWTGTPGRERISINFPGLAAYSPDGSQWAMAPWWKGACVYGADNGRVAAAFPYLQVSGCGIAFSPDGNFLVTPGADKLAQVWDLREKRLAGLLRGHDRSVLSVAWSADGRWIATGDAGGSVRIWDAATRRELWNLKAQAQHLWHVKFDRSGRRLVTAGFGPPKVWEVETGRLLRTLDDEGGGTFFAVFSSDGRRIVAACLDHQIRFWDAHSGGLVRRLTTRSQGAALWSHSPDDQRLVVCVSDYNSGGFSSPSLEIWDLQHGRRLLDLQGHTDGLFASVFSPDGRRILSSALDSTVRQWETFPWRDAEFATLPGKTLAERIRRYAERYWQQRVAAEHAGGGPTNAPPFTGDRWRPQPDREKVFWPVRATTTASNLLNLDRFYTAALNTMVYPTGAEFEFDDDLSRLPVGEQVLGGVRFDVRGTVALKCWQPLMSRHPVRADGIPVGSRARRIHVLHAAITEAPPSTVIGSYVLHYADGTQHEFEIIYGRDLRDWWHGGRGDPEGEVTEARVVWTGSNPVTERYNASLRLFLRTYENPRPEVEVVSIDFVSKVTATAPFLVAMTVEP